ncbi:MAG: hypothetical protein A2751_06000 [Candidatus Doudnabacteria bacterium RIFCSPHIGHO2_01_FULL_46_14]|uniref:Uncharacterized protein n=1 Tax=Candidatus Doudnabacteria bacterium RIFCSPHIGHO2_01_FULL_46_14 TaxID=1817824 RepID=A0A1F5NJX4_9BACT|nr:MAG: hypothetical protein A2751_06000 [Candidatus Doudnabacteria bacterium RIFCSPHIGHO2_01_FULL_46_14]
MDKKHIWQKEARDWENIGNHILTKPRSDWKLRESDWKLWQAEEGINKFISNSEIKNSYFKNIQQNCYLGYRDLYRYRFRVGRSWFYARRRGMVEYK